MLRADTSTTRRVGSQATAPRSGGRRGGEPRNRADFAPERLTPADVRAPVVPRGHEHRPVDRRHQQVGRAGRLQQRERALHPLGRDATVAQVQRGGLGQRVERLVLAVPPEVCKAGRPGRQRVAKGEVRAVRRVHEQQRAVRVRRGGERGQVCTVAIGVGRGDEHRRRARARERRRERVCVRHGKQPGGLVEPGRLQHRLHAGERGGGDGAAVAVAVQQQPVVRLEREQHGLQRGGGAVDQQKGGARPIGAGDRQLRVGDAALRRVQVVGHGQLRHVAARRFRRQEPAHAAPLVTGHVEARDIALRKVAQDARQRMLWRGGYRRTVFHCAISFSRMPSLSDSSRMEASPPAR